MRVDEAMLPTTGDARLEPRDTEEIQAAQWGTLPER